MDNHHHRYGSKAGFEDPQGAADASKRIAEPEQRTVRQGTSGAPPEGGIELDNERGPEGEPETDKHREINEEPTWDKGENTEAHEEIDTMVTHGKNNNNKLKE